MQDRQLPQPALQGFAALGQGLADPPEDVEDADGLTPGQDYAGVRLVGQIVYSLIAQEKTVITITHDIDFCAEHFERVVVMAGGRVLIEGPSQVVLSQAEILAQTYVEPPQLIRLASRLGMEWTPLTVDEFIKHLPENRE